MVSPYFCSHAPMSRNRSTCRGSISPVGIGPTLNNRLPSPLAQLISVCRHCGSDFIRSFGFQAHCWQIVMQVSQARRLLKLPTCCSGVSKSAGNPQRLLIRICGCS